MVAIFLLMEGFKHSFPINDSKCDVTWYFILNFPVSAIEFYLLSQVDTLLSRESIDQ